ncbi:MAG: SUMF1/EgtB/PvdO family nonheme iron enzyme [Chloroflexi bacterium]|nr:SUMF1/EgtB/PvdO family nonheme iron enzyme [Chloroflexota bacterium]
MDPATFALIASAPGPALVTVFTKLAEKGVIDPALEKGLEPFRDWLTGGYNVKKDEARLAKALQAALPADEKDTRLFFAFSDLRASPGLATRAAAAVVEMTTDDPARLPPDLLRDLKLDDSHRPALATALFKLRVELVKVEGFGDGIRYADQLDQRGLLRETLGHARREIEIDEAFLADRRLTTDDEKALRDYIALVREQLRYMPLPLARRSGPEARADAQLAEVFVPLTLRDPQEEEKARRRVDLTSRSSFSKRQGEIDHEEIKPASLSDVFNRHPCFLLKGPPGSGKTTLLRRAGLAFAEGSAQADLDWNGPTLLPVFVRLRNFGVFLGENRARFTSPAPGALTEFMEHYFRNEHRLSLSAGFFDRRLAEGRCLILLDGLDEVAAIRAEVAQHVNAFIRHFADKGNRFGLASRPKGYESVEVYLRPAAPAIADVNPLGPDGIRQLVSNLVQSLESNPAQRAKDSADLPQRILASRDLTFIASTPLFCTALVLVYKYHGAQLPQRRVEVYQEIVDLLLGFWKAQERELARAHELAQEDGTGAAFADVAKAVAIKKSRLAHLALWMQTERLTDAPTARARAALADYLRRQERKDEATADSWAENFLLNSHERSGLLVEIEAGKHTFTHQGFREYLAATALVSKSDDEFVRTALAHLADDWWEQVILLAGAYPGPLEAKRASLINAILAAAADPNAEPGARHARLLMAGQCAVDMAGYLPGPEQDLVERALIHLMRDTDPASADYPNDQPLHSPPSTLSPRTRLAAGELLDALGWTPPDLFDFVPVYNTDWWNLTDSDPLNSTNPLFFLSRFPVTNIQYQRFLDSDDYDKATIWQNVAAFDADQKTPTRNMGDEAWKWFQKNGGKERRPVYWDDPRFGATRRLFPVVGVTWYEAAAYCVWLSHHWREWPEASNLQPPTSNLQFRLPTEDEWEKAAGGKWKDPKVEKEKPRYAWQKTPAKVKGDEIVIAKHANTSESDLGGTTPVCMYPAGMSLAKVMDMSGNVWEWQANLYGKDNNWRALRGGAWYSDAEDVPASARHGSLPGDWGNGYGFRVCAAASVSRS